MSKPNPVVVEQDFFSALIKGDEERLEKLLAEDFLLIDVMTGSEIEKAALLDIVANRKLRFEEINRINHWVSVYGTVAVITGQTEIVGRVNGQRFELDSRYTHVLVDEGDGWRMVAAQGTRIVERPVMES